MLQSERQLRDANPTSFRGSIAGGIRRAKAKLSAWRHARRSEFVEAAALCNLLGEEMDPLRRYSLYRLGCYRSAVENATNPRGRHEAVALAISCAACGDLDRAKAAVNAGFHKWGLRGALLVETARGIAPYDLTLARPLISSIRGQSSFKAALAISAGDIALGKALIAEAISSQSKDASEAYLLASSLEDEPQKKLAKLNDCLNLQGLEALELKDSALPPSAMNLRGSEGRRIQGPLLSVVLPVYQGGKHVTAALQSLLDQTYQNIEVLAVDDGSTDNTSEILRAFAQTDSRVKLHTLPTNMGTYHARNFGVARATGTFVTVHDADDFAHPSKFASQIHPLIRDSRLVFSLSDWVRIADDGQVWSRSIYPIERLNPSSLMFRRDIVLNKLGYWDDVRFGADSEYILRMRQSFGRSAGVRVRKVLSFGAHRKGSLTTGDETGFLPGRLNKARLDYVETYTADLISQSKEKLRLNGVELW